MEREKVIYEVGLSGNFGPQVDTLHRKTTGLNSAVGSLAKSIGLVGAAFASYDFIKGSINAWREQEQAVAQLNATLKSTGGAVGLSADALISQAEALQETSLFGDDAIESTQALLATFTQIRGEIFTRTVPAILDLSQKMGQDLKSSTVQLGKALNDPVKGISALQRVGVSFTESQKSVIKSLVETNQLAKAQAMILTELETEFGGSAAAALNTSTGQMEHLALTMGDVREEIGQLVTEIGIELLPTIKKMVKAFGDAVHWVKEHKTGVKALALGLGGLVIGFKVIVPLISGFGVASVGASAGVTTLGASITAALGPIGLLVAGVIALGTAYKYLSDKQDENIAKQNRTNELFFNSKEDLNVSKLRDAQKKSGLSKSEFISSSQKKLDKAFKESNEAFGKALKSGESTTAIDNKIIELKTAQRALDTFRKDGNKSLTTMGDGAKSDTKIKSKVSEQAGKTNAIGSKSVTINVSIKDLIGTYNTNVTNMKEGADKIREIVVNALAGAINDFQIVAER